MAPRLRHRHDTPCQPPKPFNPFTLPTPAVSASALCPLRLQHTPPVAHTAGLGPYNQRIVVRLREGVHQLKLKVPQQQTPYGFYLRKDRVLSGSGLRSTLAESFELNTSLKADRVQEKTLGTLLKSGQHNRGSRKRRPEPVAGLPANCRQVGCMQRHA